MIRGRRSSESYGALAKCVGIRRENVVQVKITILGVRGISYLRICPIIHAFILTNLKMH